MLTIICGDALPTVLSHIPNTTCCALCLCVCTATDGVLDNLFPQAIHDLVVEGLDCADCADDIAAAVVARARAACEADSPHVTPWSLALKAHL